MVASLGYVGNVSKHLYTEGGPNSPAALLNPANNTQSVTPFPGFGGDGYEDYGAHGMYNGLQAKIQKRYSNGLDFLSTYTWSHSLDNGITGLSNNPQKYLRNFLLIPINYEYTNSGWDTRHRFNLSGIYDLPFGNGRRFVNHGGVANALVGGWTTSIVFVAQTGNPFFVSPNISTAAGISQARTFVLRDPFKAGGNPDPSNPGITCASSTRNRTHWYNPCNFANPLSGSNIPQSGPGSQVTSTAAAIQYAGGKTDTVYGPGYERVDMSLFKSSRYGANSPCCSAPTPLIFSTTRHSVSQMYNQTTPTAGRSQDLHRWELIRQMPDSSNFQLSTNFRFKTLRGGRMRSVRSALSGANSIL